MREDLFVDLAPDAANDLLDAWRWKVGAEARAYRVTIFGDLFVRVPDGRIYWLDTWRGTYSEVAGSSDQWAQLSRARRAEWFHWEILRELRSLEIGLKKGYVYSWIRSPMVGGKESIENIQWVSALVHASTAGQLAEAIEKLSPGESLKDVTFVLPGSSATESSDSTIYEVVINQEMQYSMWPVDREVPNGWKTVGKSGTKQECFDYIEEVWTDMRPKSLREKLDGR